MANGRWAAARWRGFSPGRAGLLAAALALPAAPVFFPAPVPLYGEIDPAALRGLLALALAQSLVLAGLALLGARLSGGKLRSGLGLAPGRLRAADLGLLILGLVALSHGLDRALPLFAPDSGAALKLLDDLLHAARNGGAAMVALAILAIGIAPGACEELLFRGFLQRWLQRKLAGQAAARNAPDAALSEGGEAARAANPAHGPTGAAVGAVICSAAAFGALHWDPVHSPLAFLLGLYLGAAALLSGDVWTPIACHMVNNLLAVTAVLCFPAAQQAAEAKGSALAALCSVMLCLACLALVARRRRRSPS